MKYADTVGLDRILADIREFAQEDPLFWQPSPLLVELVAQGRTTASTAPPTEGTHGPELYPRGAGLPHRSAAFPARGGAPAPHRQGAQWPAPEQGRSGRVARLAEPRGWLANHWPREYGGPGWNAVEKFIFEHECALAYAPRTIPFGVNMLGPVLIKYGNEAQKRYWLPRILSGADWWCQGYSEPGAGSDLASVKTSAVRQGDHYVVNGQKTWTTLGQHANMIFCLVRTDRDAKPQEGISFLLVDMNSPGVEVRPIITLDGEHEVNEVFFTDVKVPVENLVGEENRGWTCAKYLLTYERTNIAGVGFSVAALERLKGIAQRVRKNGRRWRKTRCSPRAWRRSRSTWRT